MFSVLSYHLSTLFMKVYEDVTVQDGEFLALFGDFCRGAEQLPRSVSLSAGLTKSDNDTKTSTELMDVWQGKHQGARVAIKVFRAHRSRDLGAINGVRVEHKWERFALLIQTLALAETRANVEKARASKYRDFLRNNDVVSPTRTGI